MYDFSAGEGYTEPVLGAEEYIRAIMLRFY